MTFKYSLAGVLVIAMGCTSSTASKKPSTGAEQIKGDAELAEIDYIALGFPSPDREWSPKDYLDAANALTNLRSKEMWSTIPRYEGNGAALFDRMRSESNFSILKNTSLPLGDRLPLGDQSVSH